MISIPAYDLSWWPIAAALCGSTLALWIIGNWLADIYTGCKTCRKATTEERIDELEKLVIKWQSAQIKYNFARDKELSDLRELIYRNTPSSPKRDKSGRFKKC